MCLCRVGEGQGYWEFGTVGEHVQKRRRGVLPLTGGFPMIRTVSFFQAVYMKNLSCSAPRFHNSTQTFFWLSDMGLPRACGFFELNQVL